MSEHLRLEIDGAVASLVIDRPAKRNAFSVEMWSALPELMAGVAGNDAVRAVVVRGGETFSAGADVGEFSTLRAGAAAARHYSEIVHAGERAVASLAKPTIAAVTGYCIGGGCELALACDLRIAADDARFGVTPANLGLVYNLTSTKQLMDAVGPAWARQILFTGELVDASTALRIGLVNELCPAESVVARAEELAGRIATRAQVSVRGAKAIVGRVLDGATVSDEVAEQAYELSYASADYAEGVRAFLEKRPPRF